MIRYTFSHQATNIFGWVQQSVQTTQRLVSQDSDAPHPAMRHATLSCDVMCSEPRQKSIAQIRGSSDPLNNNVGCLLPSSIGALHHRPITIQKTAHKSSLVVYWNGWKVRRQTLGLSETESAQPRCYALRGKHDAPSGTFILRSNAVGHINQGFYLFEQIVINRTNLDAIPKETPIRPNQPKQPRKLVSPVTKEGFVEGVTEYGLRQSGFRATAVQGALAHRLIVRDTWNWHVMIIPYAFQRCHLNHDAKHHAVNASKTRRRKHVERTGQQEMFTESEG